jgi:hypothetical protein
MAIVPIIQGAAAVIGVLNGLKGMLGWGDRGVALLVSNHTDYTLEILRENRVSGGWEDPPDYQIPGQSASTFSAQSSWGDCSGYLHYTILGTDPQTYLQIRWNNPFAGGNDGSTWDYVEMPPPDNWPEYLKQRFPALPIDASGFRTHTRVGSGNVAKMEFDLLLDV